MARIALLACIAATAAIGLAAQAPATPKMPAGQSSDWPDARAEVQTFVRDAIADRLKAGDIPGLDLSNGQNRVLSIQREILRSHTRLNDAPMPHVDGFTLSLRTMADLQAEADRTNLNGQFLEVSDAGVAGQDGVIKLGMYVLLPSSRKKPMLCCCSSSAAFHKSPTGDWIFQSWGGHVCG